MKRNSNNHLKHRCFTAIDSIQALRPDLEKRSNQNYLTELDRNLLIYAEGCIEGLEKIIDEIERGRREY